MKSLMYWQDWPVWRRYLPALVGVLVTLTYWTLQVAGRDSKFLITLWGLVWLVLPNLTASTVLIFAGGILVAEKGLQTRPIPLGEAVVKRHPKYWSFEWDERGRRRARRIPSDTATDALLAEALEQVKAARAMGLSLPTDPWTWPTVLHEGNSAHTGPLAWLLLFAASVLGMVALGTHPLVALPLNAVPYMVRRDLAQMYYALTAEGLWVAWPGRQAALIPKDQITRVTGTKRLVTVRTGNAWCPVVRFGTHGLAQVTLDWIERTEGRLL